MDCLNSFTACSKVNKFADFIVILLSYKWNIVMTCFSSTVMQLAQCKTLTVIYIYWCVVYKIEGYWLWLLALLVINIVTLPHAVSKYHLIHIQSLVIHSGPHSDMIILMHEDNVDNRNQPKILNHLWNLCNLDSNHKEEGRDMWSGTT